MDLPIYQIRGQTKRGQRTAATVEFSVAPLKGGFFSPRWFNSWPFHPLVGGHDSPLKGSLNHPKKGTKNCQVPHFFLHFLTVNLLPLDVLFFFRKSPRNQNEKWLHRQRDDQEAWSLERGRLRKSLELWSKDWHRCEVSVKTPCEKIPVKPLLFFRHFFGDNLLKFWSSIHKPKSIQEFEEFLSYYFPRFPLTTPEENLWKVKKADLLETFPFFRPQKSPNDLQKFIEMKTHPRCYQKKRAKIFSTPIKPLKFFSSFPKKRHGFPRLQFFRSPSSFPEKSIKNWMGPNPNGPTPFSQ